MSEHDEDHSKEQNFSGEQGTSENTKKKMCLRLSNSSDGGLAGFRPTFCQEKLK